MSTVPTDLNHVITWEKFSCNSLSSSYIEGQHSGFDPSCSLMRCFHFATVILYSELPQATLCPAGIDQAHSADAIYVLLNMCSCHQIFIKEPLHQERPIRCSENKMKRKTQSVPKRFTISGEPSHSKQKQLWWTCASLHWETVNTTALTCGDVIRSDCYSDWNEMKQCGITERGDRGVSTSSTIKSHRKVI